MTVAQQYTATPRRTQWQDLSTKHELVRHELASALERFSKGQGASSKSIVGAYGSGKSELMAWGFHYVWTHLDTPAIYINLETLLKHLPQSMSPSDLADEIERFLLGQLVEIEQNLESDSRPEQIYLSADIRAHESFADYLRELFGDPLLDLTRIRSVLAKKRAVLFLDEIEQKYGDLIERVETSDQAPLREVLQRVEQGLVPFYLVMSFGLTSAYESISGADSRRVDTLPLPIPDASEFARLGQAGEYRNLLWWASRGRPGWAVNLAHNWGSRLSDIYFLEQFTNDLAPSTIESVPLIDIGALGSRVLVSSKVNRAMADLIKAMSPVQLRQVLPDKTDPQSSQDFVGDLPSGHFLIVEKESQLLPAADLVDSLMRDLMSLADVLKESGSEWAQVRYYLHKILTAMSDVDGRLAFGGWIDKITLFSEAIIAPLLILLQDMLLEFEGDRPGTAGAISFLDRVMETCTIVGDRVSDPHKLISRFNTTIRQFKEIYSCDSSAVISPSPKTVECLFPRMVGRPLMMLHSAARGTIREQQVALESHVAATKRFIETKQRMGNKTVRFVFVPGADAIAALQDAYLGRSHRATYLAGDTVYVLLPLGEQDEVRLDPAPNSDIAVLQDLRKLEGQSIGERRVRDFVISLWHNRSTDPQGSSITFDLFEIIDAVLNDSSLSKSTRRKLEYYRRNLEDRIGQIAAISSRSFDARLKEMFDLEDPGFPEKRLVDTDKAVRESRAIEQVALAFDTVRHPAETAQLIFSLRQLEQLRQATKQPHAYSVFLADHTFKRLGKEIELSESLGEVVRFVRDRAGFLRLQLAAKNLGLDPSEDWEVSKEATDNAPLLRLYEGASGAQAVFLRGVSLHSYLACNTTRYLDEAIALANKADQLATSLKKLKTEVDEFNTELDREVLFTSDVETMLAEVEQLHDILKRASDAPPATLYILCRFAASALEAGYEVRQRWSSEHGLEGWKQNFRRMLNWRERIDSWASEIEAGYQTHRSIKEELLGSAEENKKDIRHALTTAALDVLNHLDASYQLSDGSVPKVDATTSYEENLALLQQRLDKLRDHAAEIDLVVETLEDAQHCLQSMVEELGD